MPKQIIFLISLLCASAQFQDVRPPASLEQSTQHDNINKCAGSLQVCPINEVHNGTHCTRPFSNCPRSYVWDGEKCMYQMKTCPVGFALEGNQCVAPSPICPFNSKWNGVFCKQEETSCPPGTIYRDNACFSVHTTCPFDMILQGNKCVHSGSLCPPGYQLQSNGFCLENCRDEIFRPTLPPSYPIYSCPEGLQWNGTECIRYRYPIEPCPPKYFLRNGRCWPGISPPPPVPSPEPPKIVPCPPNYNLRDGVCWPTIIPTSPPEIITCPVNYVLNKGKCYPRLMTTEPPNTHPSPTDSTHINIVITPGETIVHNNNTINKEVIVNNHNLNNVFVYSDVRCKDGSVRTMIVKNNETISGCPNDESYDHTESDPAKEQKCCDVITPRQCHRGNDSWVCSNRKYNRCGAFCSSGTVYLQPSRPVHNTSYVMIPQPLPGTYTPACTARYCPSVDCSGCAIGAQRCSIQCFASACHSTSCNFVNQETFCGTYGGQGCSLDDGCLSC